MCGIGGIWASPGTEISDHLTRMGEQLTHRGPDSGNLWSDLEAGIGLVHRRLAVVELSEAGQQPMASVDGRYILCFNGEIYNHLSIRQQIEEAGYSNEWRGMSDTETLLVSITTFGLRETLDKVVGMFAFALWDKQLRQLTLTRDRFGEKPLYYGKIKNQFFFCSELCALGAIPNLNLSINLDALSLYFRHNYVPAPFSIYQGIHKLEAGSLITLKHYTSEPEHQTYWSAPSKAAEMSHKPFLGTVHEATELVEQKLSTSIKGQLMADVPVGAFLSGGIDSSVVVALMQQQSEQNVKTFSIGFHDKNLNEAHHAKKVAEALGTNHTELYLSSTDIENTVHSLPAISDEPFADSSLLPTHAVSKLAREKVTVSLSGDGGDELFGGYTRFLAADKLINLRHRLGGAGKKTAAALINSPCMVTSLSGNPEWRWKLAQNTNRGFQSSLLLQVLKQETDALAYREYLSFWRHPNTLVKSASAPKSYFHEPERWLNSSSHQEALQMMDVQTFLTDDILTKVDRAAMNVSLETRVPMLDHRFAEFVWSLPTEFRTQDPKASLAPKHLLRTIALKYVPRNQIERPKMGFGVPLQSWLCGPLKEWAESLINPSDIRKQNILDEHVVSATWQLVLSGQPRTAELMWSILMFQHWLRSSPLWVR